jgi:hypothetical protein
MTCFRIEETWVRHVTLSIDTYLVTEERSPAWPETLCSFWILTICRALGNLRFCRGASGTFAHLFYVLGILNKVWLLTVKTTTPHIGGSCVCLCWNWVKTLNAVLVLVSLPGYPAPACGTAFALSAKHWAPFYLPESCPALEPNLAGHLSPIALQSGKLAMHAAHIAYENNDCPNWTVTFLLIDWHSWHEIMSENYVSDTGYIFKNFLRLLVESQAVVGNNSI